MEEHPWRILRETYINTLSLSNPEEHTLIIVAKSVEQRCLKWNDEKMDLSPLWVGVLGFDYGSRFFRLGMLVWKPEHLDKDGCRRMSRSGPPIVEDRDKVAWCQEPLESGPNFYQEAEHIAQLMKGSSGALAATT